MKHPMARVEGLIVEELPGETLVYDQGRDEAHCLNALAGAVFLHADGTRSVEELAELAAERTSQPVDEFDVEDVLRNLRDKHLLAVQTRDGDGISRRQMLRRGTLAGSALAAGAVISTVVAPVPSHAQTPPPTGTTPCVPAQGTCTSTSTCCNSVPCTSGVCCVPSGGACTSSAQCCTGQSLSCNSGTCNVP